MALPDSGLHSIPAFSGRIRRWEAFCPWPILRIPITTLFNLALRRTVAPLVLGISYTYSHSIDDSSDRSDADFVNSYDLAGNKASSNFDQRQSLSVSYIYDLAAAEGICPSSLTLVSRIDDSTGQVRSNKAAPGPSGQQSSICPVERAAGRMAALRDHGFSNRHALQWNQWREFRRHWRVGQRRRGQLLWNRLLRRLRRESLLRHSI